MRGLGVALSVAAHASVLAWWVARATAPGLPSLATSPAAAAVAIADPDPIEVVMLDEPETAAASASAMDVPPPGAVRGSGREADGGVAIAMAAASSIGRAPSEPDLRPRPAAPVGGGPAKRDMFKMRIGPQFHSSIQDMIDGAVDMVAEAPPPPDPTSGILQDSGNGVVHGEHSAFTMHVAHDGTVAFGDHPNGGVDQYGQPFKKELNSWVNEQDKFRSDPTVAANGSIDPGDRSGAIIIPMIGGHFDATDAIMRLRGEDPYARAKLAMLDATRDERVRMGNEDRKKQLARTPVLVSNNVARVFVVLHDPAAQRAALFDLWDECTEKGDDKALAATAVARAFIVSAIRAHFPPGSPTAYTRDELASLDHRRSAHEPFAPYDDAAISKSAR